MFALAQEDENEKEDETRRKMKRGGSEKFEEDLKKGDGKGVEIKIHSTTY